MKHNEAIKAIAEAISKRQDTIANIDEGFYEGHDDITVTNLRKRLMKEEINLTESMFLLREIQSWEGESE